MGAAGDRQHDAVHEAPGRRRNEAAREKILGVTFDLLRGGGARG